MSFIICLVDFFLFHSSLSTCRHNGKLLKCLSLHDAYPRKAREETAELDVQFAPSVSLERNAEDVYDLEADKDSLSIRYVAPFATS